MLGCVNCKKDVAPDQAKMFAQAFVCPDCFLVAERFMQRGTKEANQMLLILKESIRLALIRGELQFSAEKIEDMSPEELFKEMSQLTSKASSAQKASTCPSPKTPSRVPILPPAAGQDADGKRRSS